MMREWWVTRGSSDNHTTKAWATLTHPTRRGSSSPDRLVFRQFVGLVALDHPLGAEAPVVPQRLRPVHLGIERKLLVPRARIEVAEILVLHLVQLGQKLE